MTDWLHISHGDAPLIVSVPHSGTALPEAYESRFIAPRFAIADADWHVEKLYGFAKALGATLIYSDISRTVIDLNRDPSGVSLYPGQITTELCPMARFNGDPLYAAGDQPDTDEIIMRRKAYFDPYHAALSAEIERLRIVHPCIVLYDAHSIHSEVPRLFQGILPQFNIGTFDGASCGSELTSAIASICEESAHSHIVNGRFKGGWITRHYGIPQAGVHAIQMELAMRGYVDEAATWPEWEPARAAALQQTLRHILIACLGFAQKTQRTANEPSR